LDVRRVVGLRNTAHSLVKLMNPTTAADALLVSSYTHPEYAISMAATFELTGARALLLRGTEGEVVADARRTPQMDAFVHGTRTLLVETQAGSLVKLPHTSCAQRRTARASTSGCTSASRTERLEPLTMTHTFQPHVTLVGAGPGDPELLTLKAVKAIASATVLLVDDLVSDAITAHASPTVRIIHMGKRGGCKSTPQAFIEKLMAQEALAGETVVRLKGGDPFIFGRGGEELEHLQAQGIAVTVLNGITSGLAGVTSLGIPLTHREHAHGVVFITGHAKQGAADSVDWVALGQTAQQAKLTLVIYMGVSGAGQLQEALLQSMRADTPVAVIHQVSLPAQRHVVCELQQLNGTLVREQLASPSVIVIGDVFKGLLAMRGGVELQASAG
jgi:uroporphyrin-III C-methyltransferase